MPNAAGRFDAPWRPGSDAYNADPNALLRADNLTRDEAGIAALRLGSVQLSDVGDKPVVSLRSVVFDNREVIAHVDEDALYVDGVVVEDSTLEGEGDIALGATHGHLLLINGDTKLKYDGETLRQWGIDAPTDAPDIEVVDVASSVIANFSQASAEFTASEGTRSYVTGYDGVANAATGIQPAVGTGRGILTYTFASQRDLLNLPGGRGGDYDVFSLWVDDPQPERFTFLQLDIGVSEGSDPFLTDYYWFRFGSLIDPIVQLTQQEIGESARRTEAAVPEPPVVPPPPGRHRDPEDTPGRQDPEDRRDRRRREVPD